MPTPALIPLETRLAATLALAREPLSADALHALAVAGGWAPEDATLDDVDGYLAAEPGRSAFRETAALRPALEAARATLCAAARDWRRAAPPLAPYLLRHGVSHLVDAGQADAAVRCLTDFGYLVERLRSDGASGVRGVGDDWRLLARAGAVQDEAATWARFWRAHAHLLARGDAAWPAHKILVQLAWEHADRSPVTRAAERWLAAGGCDWTWLRLRPDLRPSRLAANARERTLEGHDGAVTALVFAGDGRRAVSASDDGTVRVWDLETGACERVLTGHRGSVHAVAVAGDGRRAVSAGDDRTLRVWDLESGACAPPLTGHDRCVTSVAISADGARAASAGEDDMLRVWDLDGAACRRVVPLDHGWIPSVALSGDGRLAVVVDEMSRDARVWDLATEAPPLPLAGHRDGVAAVAVGGARAVTGGRDGTLRVWDLASRRCREVLEVGAWIEDVAISADGRCVVAADWNQRLHVWTVAGSAWRRLVRGSTARAFAEHPRGIRAVAVSADGARAVSGGEEGRLYLWDLTVPTGEPRRGAGFGRVTQLALDASRTRVAAPAGGTLSVWDLATGSCVRELPCGAESTAVAWMPDDRRLLSGHDDGRVRIWSASTGECAWSAPSPMKSIHAVAPHPDGRRVAAAGRDGLSWRMCIWDPAGPRGERVLDRPAAERDEPEVARRLRHAQVDASLRTAEMLDRPTAKQDVAARLRASLAPPVSSVETGEGRDPGAVADRMGLALHAPAPLRWVTDLCDHALVGATGPACFVPSGRGSVLRVLDVVEGARVVRFREWTGGERVSHPPEEAAFLAALARQERLELRVTGVRRGGMGVVYLCDVKGDLDPFFALLEALNDAAATPERGWRCAIKVLRPERSVPKAREQFLDEARRWARLGSHANIVTLHRVATIGSRLFLLMEAVEGDCLRERIDAGPPPLAHALGLAAQVATGMDHAWRETRLIHRDLKPENILLTEAGVAKVADFGIAVESGARTGGAGTPAYMAPEQWRGAPADVRTDLYSFGLILYELLAGRHAFPGVSSRGDLRGCHLDVVPDPIERLRPEVPPAVATLVARCLAKAPGARPADWTDVLRVLAPSSPSFPDRDATGAPAGALEHARVARHLFALGRFDEARRRLAAAIDLDPRDAQLRREHGRCLAASGRLTDAVAGYDQCLDMAPNDISAWIAKGECLAVLRREHEAESAFLRALSLADHTPADERSELLAFARHRYGVFHAEFGRYDHALSQLDRARSYARYTQAAVLHLHLALTHACLAHTDLALDHAEESLRLAPRDSGAWCLKLAILDAAGRTDAANACLPLAADATGARDPRQSPTYGGYRRRIAAARGGSTIS